MDSSALWSAVALLVLSRWLHNVALCRRDVAVAVLALAGVILWAVFPMLAQMGATPLTQGLVAPGVVISVIVCCEAWILSQSKQYWSLLSLSSVAGMFYLLALLFQGGWIPSSFGVQTVFFFLAMLTVTALYRLLAIRWNVQKLDQYFHQPAIWLACWIGYASWPDGSDLIDASSLRDTALLLVSLPLFAAFSVLVQWGLKFILRSQRTLS